MIDTASGHATRSCEGGIEAGGPVSVAFEDQLRQYVSHHGLAVLLDPKDHYSGLVERLRAAEEAGRLPYPVRSWHGSYLELMFELEPLTGDVDIRLLLHLPGLHTESVKQTPLFELYKAGHTVRQALETLVRDTAAGQVAAEEIERFLETEAEDLTLEAADRWLAAWRAPRGSRDELDRLTAILYGKRPIAALDDLLTTSPLAAELDRDPARQAFWRQWHIWTGLPESWRRKTQVELATTPRDMAAAAAGWALAVEYVDDLRRPPVHEELGPATQLADQVVTTNRNIAEHLRQHHPRLYRQTAADIESFLAAEVKIAEAEDLGQIDTFRFEEDIVLGAALKALGEGRWQLADTWAGQRVGDRVSDQKGVHTSFWLRHDLGRGHTWQLVHVAARLGLALEVAGVMHAETLDDALAEYAERGATVDRAHRELLQRRSSLEHPRVAKFDVIRARLDAMQVHWRRWAESWARHWNQLCRSGGFLPAAEHQQRTLFTQVVAPLAKDGVTAYFTLDAFRYEMAVELCERLGEAARTGCALDARLAELPTVTEVGMNVLAPLERGGRLAPAGLVSGQERKIKGFDSGEFRVKDPRTRARAMHDHVGGDRCPALSLDEVVRAQDIRQLKKKIARARIVLIYSRELDDAGEIGLGPSAFDDILTKVRTAWHLLRDAGIRRFVFTADHGFLLFDPAAGVQAAGDPAAGDPAAGDPAAGDPAAGDPAAGTVAVTHGRPSDPRRRCVFTPVAVEEAEKVSVELEALRYDGAAGFLVMPAGVAPFRTRGTPKDFFHGGNSPQERVIPVLTVVHRAPAGGAAERLALRLEPQREVAGMHCLKIEVREREQGRLAFGGQRRVDLALRVPEDRTVQVELCEARDLSARPAQVQATVRGSRIEAPVGSKFELFFRLSAAEEARVRVEVYHPGAEVELEPSLTAERYAVLALPQAARPEAAVDADEGAPEAASGDSDAPPAEPEDAGSSWLEELPEEVRAIYAHLEEYGTITEVEIRQRLGSARAQRKFARSFETHAAKAPFDVRIESVGGVTHYLREGGRR